jgi:hypothetical protein
MSPSGDDSDDKVVINPLELGFASRSSKGQATAEEVAVRARGTRQQLPISCESPISRSSPISREPPPSTRAQPPLAREYPPPDPRTRDVRGAEPVRDPLEVLRTWPHSMSAVADPSLPSRATLPAPSGKRVFEDKILLAHLALDLFREVDELHRSTQDVRPGKPAAVVACENPCCDARSNALRGAVVEACLLVQRAVLMAPPSSSKTEIETSLRGLLVRIER